MGYGVPDIVNLIREVTLQASRPGLNDKVTYILLMAKKYGTALVTGKGIAGWP